MASVTCSVFGNFFNFSFGGYIPCRLEAETNPKASIGTIRAEPTLAGPRRGGVRGGQKPGAHSHKGPINSN